ncbi:ArsR/SmtB family transcription factor [Embleya scabrispora]|uniref:ArsR/SmtB family transcription factor n=1 Tax=Embleya scabrispora TaxID=159449 RepID=UPI000365E2EE|nr:DUF5937 family protein [Embleya scabrispora]MYS85632.1 helix-turn-helix domain-containing protein [Streptomyces sp. SID5474]
MLGIEVGPADMARSRFGISPLGEVVWVLRTLSGSHQAGPLRPWIERLRPAYDRLRREQPAVAAMTSLYRRRGYNADFLHPPPSGTPAGIGDELAVLRATPLARARSELVRNLEGLRAPSASARALLDSPDVVARLADAIEAAWTTLVEPEWPALRAVLEHDLVRTAGRLAAYGWGAALGDLSPRLRWRDEGVIEVVREATDTVTLDGAGLLFVPSAFGALIVYVEPPWPYAIVYPARGVAELLGAPARSDDEALADLLGTTRATILRALATQATTTQLAARLNLGLGTVGDHLAVLRRADLITGLRVGHSVHYRRTTLGEVLANGRG